MWYLNRGEKGYDMNVEEAWALGITGKGKKNVLCPINMTGHNTYV